MSNGAFALACRPTSERNVIVGRFGEILRRLPRDASDTPFGRGDIVLAGEHPERDVVAALLAVLEPDQLAALGAPPVPSTWLVDGSMPSA